MPHIVRDLIASIEPDPWRRRSGFSPQIGPTHDALLSASSDDERTRVVSEWLQQHQPCLFGRVAAALGVMHFCFLTSEDLQRSDDEIREQIQRERRAWRRAAFEGRSSGFIILALSDQIARARPDDVIQDLAKRLCSLYLLTDVEVDQIYLEDLHLEVPGPARGTYHWRAGVNYFSSTADGRWWQDHRIPGGLAFSVNSVGHFVKARALAEGMGELEQKLGLPSGDWISSKIDSLGQALVFAMRTIGRASEAVSGRATELKNAPHDPTELPKCPVDLPKDLVGKDHCTYTGFYHTDITLPSEYFIPAVERPPSATRQDLDFTYLFDPQTSNVSFYTMGAGVPIRDMDPSPAPFTSNTLKALRTVPSRLSLGDTDKLIAYLYGA